MQETYLAAIDNVKLFNSRREKKASHNQEQGDEDEVEEEWKQGEEE